MFLIEQFYSIYSFFSDLNTEPSPSDIVSYSKILTILDKIPVFIVQTIFLKICMFKYIDEYSVIMDFSAPFRSNILLSTINSTNTIFTISSREDFYFKVSVSSASSSSTAIRKSGPLPPCTSPITQQRWLLSHRFHRHLRCSYLLSHRFRPIGYR